ncbi:MAG TPA: response regulator [Thermoanaerobaculia bacterium]
MTTVLIVDDNATFRMQAARLCEREGFTTLTAGSLSELAVVLSGARPDLVLVDIELPQIPGHRLGALIRSRHQVPIVLVSALREERVRKLFEASDADGWICKPLTRDKLIGAVTRFVLGQTPAAEATAPRTSGEVRGAGSRRLLLVEDEPVIASRIEFALAPEWTVTTVSDGRQAIQQMLDEPYDCILLDLTLERLSGFDVLRHAILRQPELLRSTVIMTAANDESLQFIERESVAGVLRKPFEMAALSGIVGKAAGLLGHGQSSDRNS